MVKRIIILLFSAFAVLSCTVKTEDRTVSVIPQPQHIGMPEKPGSFVLDRDCAILLDEPTEEMYRIAGFLNEKLSKAAGFTLQIKDVDYGKKEKGIYFMNAGNPSEAYNLHVMPEMVVVDYGDGAGAFYALQTIIQLLSNQKILFIDAYQISIIML